MSEFTEGEEAARAQADKLAASLLEGENKVAAETAALKNDAVADFHYAAGYTKKHFVWIAGLLGLIVGFIAGHFAGHFVP
jgi:hypothetical protein